MKILRYFCCVACLSVLFLCGCYQEQLKPVRVTILNSRFTQFCIDGGELIQLEDFSDALQKYQQEHPNQTYELFSEYIILPVKEIELRKIFNRSGIKLKHFWVPGFEDVPGDDQERKSLPELVDLGEG